MADSPNAVQPDGRSVLPGHRGLFYGGRWHEAEHGASWDLFSPGDGAGLGVCADASDRDVDAAVAAAHAAWLQWRDLKPLDRAGMLRRAAAVIRSHSAELALIDAYDGGNAVTPMSGDIEMAAQLLEFFAGLVSEIKGETIPMGHDRFNFTLRQPLGVVVRIGAFNHPIMFSAGKVAAPLAAGNTVIVKPPEQAPLSTLRLAELWQDVFPPGVFSVVTGKGVEVGQALVRHPDVAKVALIGSVAAGRAVMRAASDRLKPVLLELGGKNALIAFPDCEIAEVADAIVAGMNFAWCGQSCGSTSRAFVHEAIHDRVLDAVLARLPFFRPGLPQLPETTMGAIVDARQHRRILEYIGYGTEGGATLAYGGQVPDDPALARGLFVQPTVFSDVTAGMRIAREEIFGPVLSVLRWKDEAEMLSQVNDLEYGLTSSIWTNDLSTALRVSHQVEAGYVWVNEVARHFVAAPFGGFKQSSTGREECLDELISFTQNKNVHVKFKAAH